jgi:D-aminopeptidase
MQFDNGVYCKLSRSVKDPAASAHSSRNIFMAFSSANLDAVRFSGIPDLKMIPDNSMGDLLFTITEATEEAINAMVGAETMTGANHQTVVAFPHEVLRQALKKYNLLQ